MKAFVITLLVLGLIASAICSLFLYAHGHDLIQDQKSIEKAQTEHAADYVALARQYTADSYALLGLDQTPTELASKDDCLEMVLLAMHVMESDRWDGREPTKAHPGIAPALPRAATILEDHGILVTAFNESIAREGANERAQRLKKLYDNRPEKSKQRRGWWDKRALGLYKWFNPPKAEPLQQPRGEFDSRFDQERATDAKAQRRIKAYRAKQNVLTMHRVHAALTSFDNLPYGCESRESRQQAQKDASDMMNRSDDTIAFGWNAR